MANDGRPRVLLWVVVGGGAFFLFLIAVFTLVYISMRDQRKDGFGGFGEKIAVVDIEGVIVQPKTVADQLKRYGDDSSIKAIILHINTPGGGVAASQEMYDAVRRIRDKKKKPIIASIETVGASGGYYVASGTNKIFADRGSIVGSIGVIAQWVNYEDLLRWAKLKDVTMKAGALKDAGNPAREMTPEEKAYFQSLIDNMHTQFVKAVAEGRKMKEDDVRSIASGRVWTGEQALDLKLIDQIGDFQDCVEDTAKAVGIKGEPTLVHPEKERKTLLDVLFGDATELLPDFKAKMLERNPSFYYLWK